MSCMASLLHGSNEVGWDKWQVGQCNDAVVWCIVLDLDCGIPRDSPEVTRSFFYLDSLWGLWSWSSSVNSLFSLGTGMGRKYMPSDSSLQIPLSFSDLLLLLTVSFCCWYYLDTSAQIWTFLIFKRVYVQLDYLFSLNVQKLFKVLFVCFWNRGLIYFWNCKLKLMDLC